MIKLLLIPFSLLMLTACTAEQPDTNTGTAAPKAAQEKPHGKPHPLAKIRLKTFDRIIKITRLGEIEAGKEGAIEVAFNTSEERISTMRTWIGIESGVGSIKGKGHIEGDHKMHAHIEVPDPIPPKSKLWLTFEADDKTETISLPYQ